MKYTGGLRIAQSARVTKKPAFAGFLRTAVAKIRRRQQPAR